MTLPCSVSEQLKALEERPEPFLSACVIKDQSDVSFMHGPFSAVSLKQLMAPERGYRTTRGGFRGSSLGSFEPPFLKLVTYQQSLLYKS